MGGEFSELMVWYKVIYNMYFIKKDIFKELFLVYLCF